MVILRISYDEPLIIDESPIIHKQIGGLLPYVSYYKRISRKKQVEILLLRTDFRNMCLNFYVKYVIILGIGI